MKRIVLLLFPLLCLTCFAQVPVTPVTLPHVTFVNGAGLPCAFCTLGTYAAGTTTPLATYTDSSGGPQNPNPIVLDAAGGANIWMGANSYKLILKDASGTTIWSVDQVNAARLFPCGSSGAIQVANSTANGLTCDSTITINTTTHSISVGTLPANHVTIGAVGTPTLWTFDTTTPATALASLGGNAGIPGTAGQLVYYPTSGSTTAGTNSIPAGITAITAPPSDNSTKPATTAYVAAPGAINPTSVQVGTGSAITDNQGNGAKVQHSTGAVTGLDCARYDANGNIADAGVSCASLASRTCNANGCYRVEGDGTIIQWGSIAGCSTSSGRCSVSVSFPTTFTTTTNLSIEATCESGPENCVTSVANGATSSGFIMQFGALVFIGGSGGNLSGFQTGKWVAIGY